MNVYHQIWQEWANKLLAMGLENYVASLLEAVGPLNIVGAQMIYLGQPILRGLIPNKNINALAYLLEDDMHTQKFVALLKEVPA